MYQFFGALMEDYDLFLCPTTTVPAVAADHDATAQDYQIDGVTVDPEYGWVLTHHFNMLHHCPVMAVPSGFAASGVPQASRSWGAPLRIPWCSKRRWPLKSNLAGGSATTAKFP